MKLVKRIALVVVVLVIIGIVVVLLSLDHIIKSTVQSQASSALGVTTSLDSAHMSLTGGQLNLRILDIGSPSGFSAPKMLGLGEAEVGVNYSQLMSNPMHIDHVTLTGPAVTIEQHDGKLNFQAVMAGGGNSGSAPTSSSGGAQGQPMKVVIDHLTITGAQVTILAGIPGLDRPITIDIPAITLTNIGNDNSSQNGAGLKEVIMQVITAMVAEAKDSDKLPQSVRAILNANVADMARQLGGNLQKDLGQTLGNLGNGTKTETKNLLGNLLGGDKSK